MITINPLLYFVVLLLIVVLIAIHLSKKFHMKIQKSLENVQTTNVRILGVVEDTLAGIEYLREDIRTQFHK